MVWIKGSRCGIGNCASQFYQILGGRRVCQYGHVQEGLETAGDDDDYNAFGRKVRTPQQSQLSQLALASQKSEESHSFRGNEARLVTLELLQVILRHQIDFLKTVRKMPSCFEKVTRDLWSIFLNMNSNNTSPISLVHLVSLLYLSTRLINVPVLLADFNLWIRTSELPYLQAWRLLDPRIFDMMPPEQKKQLRAASEPGYSILHLSTKNIKKKLEKSYPTLKFIEIDDRYVCFRICRDLLLPPQIYTGAMRLLEFVKHMTTHKGSVAQVEEIRASCLVVISAKLYFGFDHIKRKIPKNELFDFELWSDILRKTWLLHPDLCRSDERLVEYWSGEDVDLYLDWFQNTILPPPEAKSHLDKRLESMFPLLESNNSVVPYADQETLMELSALVQSTIENNSEEEDSEVEATPSGKRNNRTVHGEDVAATPKKKAKITEHSDGDSVSENGAGDSNNNITPDDDNEGAEPGTVYQSYAVRADLTSELPDYIGVIFAILAKYFGSDEHTIRQNVQSYEKFLHRSNERFFPVKPSTTGRRSDK